MSELDLYTGSALTGGAVDVPGFSAVTMAENAARRRRVIGAAEIWADFKEGRLDPFYMRQAFTSRRAASRASSGLTA
jgi:hypothetical protein